LNLSDSNSKIRTKEKECVPEKRKRESRDKKDKKEAETEKINLRAIQPFL